MARKPLAIKERERGQQQLTRPMKVSLVAEPLHVSNHGELFHYTALLQEEKRNTKS